MDRPKDFISSLGPDVQMTTEKVKGTDPRLDEMLREIGSRISAQLEAQGMEYQGSFAIHLVRTKEGYGAITGKYDMATITQIAINEGCSEQLCTLGFNNAVLQLRRYFHPGATSGRRGDKR